MSYNKFIYIYRASSDVVVMFLRFLIPIDIEIEFQFYLIENKALNLTNKVLFDNLSKVNFHQN